MKCAPGEVHVWRIELDRVAIAAAALKATLSLEEQRRAARFQSKELGERWAVAHGALRCIVARYARCQPGALVFQEGPKGKPALTGPGEEISFNLCHTDALALVAIAGIGRVGIDAEAVRSSIEVEDLSRRYFAPAEADEILALSPDAQLGAFFACWTRKEAFVKALGGGLAVPMDHFQVSVRSNEPARLLWIDGEECDQWTLLDISEPGIAAALVVEGLNPVLQRISFVPPS